MPNSFDDYAYYNCEFDWNHPNFYFNYKINESDVKYSGFSLKNKSIGDIVSFYYYKNKCYSKEFFEKYMKMKLFH